MTNSHWSIMVHGKTIRFLSINDMIRFFEILDMCLYDKDSEWSDEGRLTTIKTYFELWQDKKQFKEKGIKEIKNESKN